jgi:molybdopterin-guanine dinucleotide biosynthesis protein A
VETQAHIAGLVLAGGRSARFGAPKAQAVLGDASLATHVARALKRHVGMLAIAGAASPTDFDATVLADPADAPPGPLAGILAGLEWAADHGVDWLATAPCDAPLIPTSLVPRLFDAASASGARLALAATRDGWQPLCALWRTDLAEDLRRALAGGRHPSVQGFAKASGASVVTFEDADGFLNINTPQDFALAQAILARRRD